MTTFDMRLAVLDARRTAYLEQVLGGFSAWDAAQQNVVLKLKSDAEIEAEYRAVFPIEAAA